MSITVTIANNRDFCRANGLAGETRYGCQRCEWDGKINPTCMECAGKGYVAFEDLPFDMNICDGNFRTIWAALGLDYDHCGELDGRTLLRAIMATSADMLVKAPCEEGCMIFVGVDFDQADRYLSRLLAIANEAARREEKVVWY